MSYRLAETLKTLRNEVDKRWPDRDRTSDGWIGDAAHASRNSDHNPWIKDASGTGVVRAIDIDEDGIDGPAVAERIRALGASGDVRLYDNGYVIYEGQIAGGRPGRSWDWRPYSGTNAHKHHIHVSASRDAAGYDSTAAWLTDPPPTTEGLVMDSEVAARFDALEGKLDRLIASARTETARDLETVRGLRKLLVKLGLARG